MLNSLYEKAIAKRGFIHDIDSDSNVESQLEYNWFDRHIDESSDDFTCSYQTDSSQKSKHKSKKHKKDKKHKKHKDKKSKKDKKDKKD